jgi:hypothetical protein
VITPEAQAGRSALQIAVYRSRRTLAMLFCLALLMPAVATGQDSKGKKDHPPYALIFGTVWSADGSPVPGVSVRIRLAQEKKAKWRLVSDRRGEFAQRVPAGKASYVVWADIKMPKGQSPPEVRVQIENDERVDIGLHLTR